MKINQSHSSTEITPQAHLLTVVVAVAQERRSVALGKIRQSFRPSKFWRKRNSQRNIDFVGPDMDLIRVRTD
jgi:hypothetical protein